MKRSRKTKSKRGDHQKIQQGPMKDSDDQDINDDESSVEDDEDDDNRAKQVDAKN
jgi:hypothetical protein